MDATIEPTDERIEVGPGLRLRVLRWLPPANSTGGAVGPSAVSSAGSAVGASAGSPTASDSTRDPVPWLLVHGLASNARLWDGVARRLAGAGHPAAAVDLRGHGRSGKPDTGYDFASISSDLASLLAALGPEFDRPVVAGQSWGAGVALDFAVRTPGSIRGIVLVDGGLTDLRDGFPSWEACWERLAPPQLIGLPISTVESHFATNHPDWPEEGIRGSLANFDVRSDGTIAPWLTRERHKAILLAMWHQRTADLWAALRVPALIVPVDGGQVQWTAGKRSGADMAVAAAASSGTPVRVRWFEGDHDIHAQHPSELVEVMLDAERGGLFAGRPATADARHAAARPPGAQLE